MTPPKFRVWDGSTMHEPPHDFLLGSDGSLYKNSFYLNADAPKLDGTPLFDTGLMDVGNTEIYEADVVDLKNRYTTEVDAWRGIVRIGEYTLAHGDLSLTLRGVYLEIPSIPDTEMTVSKEAWGDAAVLGNIYEDPDLIEQKVSA